MSPANPPPQGPKSPPGPPPEGYKKVGHLIVPKTVSKASHIVQWLAAEMERQLAATEHKDNPETWRTQDVWGLFQRLDEARRNLRLATEDKDNLDKVLPEAANVAIAAMRIADWFEHRITMMEIRAKD
jgi:hypothetical protein